MLTLNQLQVKWDNRYLLSTFSLRFWEDFSIAWLFFEQETSHFFIPLEKIFCTLCTALYRLLFNMKYYRVMRLITLVPHIESSFYHSFCTYLVLHLLSMCKSCLGTSLDICSKSHLKKGYLTGPNWTKNTFAGQTICTFTFIFAFIILKCKLIRKILLSCLLHAKLIPNGPRQDIL